MFTVQLRPFMLPLNPVTPVETGSLWTLNPAHYTNHIIQIEMHRKSDRFVTNTIDLFPCKHLLRRD